jgi:CubicO group peptidase (beta-lactamase class C family)
MATIPEHAQRVLDGLLVENGLALWDQRQPLAARMRHVHAPGVSLAIVEGGEVAWAGGVGVLDASEALPRPVTADSLFQAASISKPTFALLVMRLVAEGVLDLDRDVNDDLAGAAWQVPDNNGWQPRISLRQLLTHRAGLTVPGFPGYRRGEPLPSVPQMLRGEPPANSEPVRCNLVPGFTVRYSGGGTLVAQYVVETVTGQPLAGLMEEQVLRPLGMLHSTYAQPLPESWHARAATAHPSHGEPVPGRWHDYPEQAAAGLWTTPADLARLGIALQRALAGQATGFLTPDLAAEMLSPQFGGPNGIGWWLYGDGPAQRFGHDGDNEGFHARLTMLMNRGQGVVVMVNAGLEAAELRDQVERTVALEFGWPPYAPPPARRAPPPAELAQAAGTYRSPKPGAHRFRVAAAEAGLRVRVDDQPPLAFDAVAGGFTTAAVNARLRFDDGDLVWEQEGEEVRAQKTE